MKKYGELIYNVTIKISNDKQKDWLSWVKEVHIPNVMATQMFTHFIFTKVCVADAEGTNYSIQFFCENKAKYAKYQSDFAAPLEAAHHGQFSPHFVLFRTLLEIV